MKQTVLLVHAPATYAPEFSAGAAEILPRLFAERAQALGLPVVLSIGNEKLLEVVKPLFPKASIVEAQSEIQTVRALFGDQAIEHIVVVTGIFPLLDGQLTRKLYDLHTKYRADITYGENLPPGIAGHIVSRDLLESLDIMEAQDADLAAPGIRAFVEKNINQFHAEVHYEEPDLRLLRLDFSLANARSVHKTAALAPLLVADAPYQSLKPVLDSQPGQLVSFPSYIELEFSSTADHVSYFSPLRVIDQPKHQLQRAHFDKVMAYVESGFGDTSVCASGLGEPLEHPECATYLGTMLSNPKIRQVFVETNGLHLDKLWPLATHAKADKLRVIVMLNSLEKYTDLSGAPFITLERVKANIQSLARALDAAGHKAAEIVYLQVLKVIENEAEIDALYALAEELGVTFLLQKYNRYAGLLPERRVSNMTPLERYACWHLRRDLFIRADGSVAFCKQTVDPSKPTSRGHMDTNELADLWGSQRADFVANYQGEFPPHLPCATCDEYFTFNF